MFKKFKYKINTEYNEHNISMNHGDFDDVFDSWLIIVLSCVFPSYAIGFVTGLIKKHKYDFRDLIQIGFFTGSLKTMIYPFVLMMIHTIVCLKNPVLINSINDFASFASCYKYLFALFVSDNLLVSWFTLPFSYLLGRDAKKGISKIKKKSKEKKELLLEQKKELEKELAKDYIVSPEVMEYTKSNRRKEIEDYKKLREEYAPTIPTEVVAQNDKVLGLK